MQLNILNTKLLGKVDPTFTLSIEDIHNGYIQIFKDYSLEDINIVFVDTNYIKQLNSKYRDIDASTDVLSFDLDQNSKGGEIYICPQYIYQSFSGDQFEDEVLRVIIHGTLHILGYDHTQSLNDSPNEDMFVLQKDLLLKYKKLCF